MEKGLHAEADSLGLRSSVLLHISCWYLLAAVSGQSIGPNWKVPSVLTVNNYRYTQCNISEERRPLIERGGTLKLSGEHLLRKITNAMHVLKVDICCRLSKRRPNWKSQIKWEEYIVRFYNMLFLPRSWRAIPWYCQQLLIIRYKGGYWPYLKDVSFIRNLKTRRALKLSNPHLWVC